MCFVNALTSVPVLAGDPEDVFLRRVRQSAVAVLGDSPIGRQVRQLCDAHAEHRRGITTDRTAGAMVVAIIGATGQGKSWLMRQFVKNEGVAKAIRSGNNIDEATERIVWVGSVPPANLDLRFEQFLHCPVAQMRSLGVPYLLVDSPGATDHRRDIADTARLALSMASVLIVVVRRDQLRSHTVDMLAVSSEGALVVPVVNAVTDWDDAAIADTEAFMARIRRAAPTSRITSAVPILDFDANALNESQVGDAAVTSIIAALAAEVEQGDSLSRTTQRLNALDAKFRTALHTSLHDQLPGLTAAVKRLNDEAKSLPEEIAESLVGGGPSLRAAIRSRLRASLLVDTSAFWFPYRTILGVLSLTSGAWDRVVLSLAGSLPSLVMAAYSGIRNFNDAKSAAANIREGIRGRSAAAVADRLGPLATRFRAEVHRLGNAGSTADNDSAIGRRQDHSPHQPAYLAGIDALQERSQDIVETEIERIAPSHGLSALLALVATFIFWALMTGPVVALYRGYVAASYTSLHDLADNLEQFPKVEFAMLATSVILSLLPTAIFTMFVLSWVQSRRRIDQAEATIRAEHRDAITSLQREHVLRLQWDDPLLADAEFLLSAGANDPSFKNAL